MKARRASRGESRAAGCPAAARPGKRAPGDAAATASAYLSDAMTCPLLRRSQPAACRAVADGPASLSRAILDSYCRGSHGDCPAYRYVRAAGQCVHPADFRAWVILDLVPGRMDPRHDPAATPADAP